MQAADLTVDTPMGVILETLPGARRTIFARYHLGGCQGCAFAPDETLAQLAARSEVPADEMLAHLIDSNEHDLKMLIDPVEAKESLATARLIDIRTREENDAVVIPGSEFFTQDLQQELFAGNPQTFIILYDHSGNHVLDQVAWFRGHGLKETYGLRGGIDAWSQQIDDTLPRYRLEME